MVWGGSVMVWGGSVMVWGGSVIVWGGSVIIWGGSVIVWGDSVIVWGDSVMVWGGSVIVWGGSVIVQGGISGQQQTNIIVIDGNLTTHHYINQVLRPVLLPLFQHQPIVLFQQDNARPHTAHGV